jgi:hypothetical protein
MRPLGRAPKARVGRWWVAPCYREQKPAPALAVRDLGPTARQGQAPPPSPCPSYAARSAVAHESSPARHRGRARSARFLPGWGVSSRRTGPDGCASPAGADLGTAPVQQTPVRLAPLLSVLGCAFPAQPGATYPLHRAKNSSGPVSGEWASNPRPRAWEAGGRWGILPCKSRDSCEIAVSVAAPWQQIRHVFLRAWSADEGSGVERGGHGGQDTAGTHGTLIAPIELGSQNSPNGSGR